jgi:hypothetical protein
VYLNWGILLHQWTTRHAFTTKYLMTHSANLLSLTAQVHTHRQTVWKSLYGCTNRLALWPLYSWLNNLWLLSVGSLKDTAYKTNLHTLEKLRNNIHSEISMISRELQRVNMSPTVVLYAFGQKDSIFSICCSTGEFLLDF